MTTYRQSRSGPAGEGQARDTRHKCDEWRVGKSRPICPACRRTRLVKYSYPLWYCCNCHMWVWVTSNNNLTTHP